MTTKSDPSIHSICIAAIKRHTMKPYDFRWTQFYESNTDFKRGGLDIDLEDEERVICATILDMDNFSILTTRKLLTRMEGLSSSTNLQGATKRTFGFFKGEELYEWTNGELTLQNGQVFRYHIETGRASMVMIYGVDASLKLRAELAVGKEVYLEDQDEGLSAEYPSGEKR